MRVFSVIVVSLLPLSLLHADSMEQRQLNRYLALQQRVQVACEKDTDSDLCQAWLQGMQQGVQAMGEQVEEMASRWALVHERDQSNYPRAWITRDVLQAVSCTPDALMFVSSYAPSPLLPAPRAAAMHVANNCGPIWTAQHLTPSVENEVSISLH